MFKLTISNTGPMNINQNKTNVDYTKIYCDLLQASTRKVLGPYMHVLGHYKCILAQYISVLEQYISVRAQYMTTSLEYIFTYIILHIKGMFELH